MFNVYQLSTHPVLQFEGVLFEELTAGRSAANFYVAEDPRSPPLMRTTAKYGLPAQPITPELCALLNEIRRTTPVPVEANTVLVERYTRDYSSMGFHSDMALDLAPQSHIAILTQYAHPDQPPSRTLTTKDKHTGDTRQIVLAHNSLVVFSTETNQTHLHKISMHTAPSVEPDNVWTGITFRLSKTTTPEDLRMATPDEEIAFYRLKREENRATSFVFPDIPYTISRGDLPDP